MIELPDTSTEKGQYEASAILARLMGWKVEPDTYYLDTMLFTKLDGTERIGVNLYHPGDMSLAWRALNWAMEWERRDIGVRLMLESYIVDGFAASLVDLPRLPPEVAQRAWLDKILQLANEAGMLDGES